ncbi:E3 ubiquitin-protein ligase MSL2 isoform X2 [Eurytemora carolleeae]|nr:E3 ubiquitin-protein ligase MSL2 isoform X2 [Eurytemora carolleeae]|eukprot:XP_023319646.1 E3 ubiquitin-protein ligase MSL2-like isoform X2 [Eurytemora affinis]
MLRNSMSCTVCEHLLTEPYTPEESSCQHHVCKGCRGGVKVLRPSCSWCKDYSLYTENVQLRLLIQSYRKLCSLIKVTKLYENFQENTDTGPGMLEIIRESEMKNRVGFSGSGFSRQPSQQVKQEVYSEEEEIHQSNREQDQTRLSSDISSLDHNRLNPKPFSEHILTPEHSTLSPEQTEPCDNIRTSPTKSNLSLDESTGRTDGKGMEYTTVKLNPMVKLELNYDLELHSSTHQREGKEDILNDQGENMDTDESRLSRDESRLSRDESRVFRDESRISRDESRLSRDEYSLENTPFIQVDSMKMESIESIKHEYYPTPSHTPRRSASRSETPSPPNSRRYSTSIPCTESVLSSAQLYLNTSSGSNPESNPNLLRGFIKSRTHPKIRETFILQPRANPQGETKVVQGNSGWESNVNRLESMNVMSTTPMILPRNSPHSGGRSLLKPPEKPPLGKGKERKAGGCRCGNATACPGKLTCCGQRCPCYVSRLACVDCKCKGCNNPNLPGGGKVLPYINAALNLDGTNAIKFMTTINKPSQPGSNPGLTRKLGSSLLSSGVRLSTGGGRSVVRVPSSISDSIDSMTDVDINTIPVVNLSSPSAYTTLVGSSPLADRLVSRSSPGSSFSPPSSLSSFSVLPSSSFTQSSMSTVRVVPASSLSAVSIPLSSLTTSSLSTSSFSSSGLKLRPVDQLQPREIKARVIPTSFRLKPAPYTRLGLNNGGNLNGANSIRLQTKNGSIRVQTKDPSGAIRFQTVNLMSLLKGQHNQQISTQVLKEGVKKEVVPMEAVKIEAVETEAAEEADISVD